VANAFLKAERIVSQGLGLLQRELILPRLVTRLADADFKGTKNDTVNIRIPSLLAGREYEWRTRTQPIIVDDLNETSIPVTLNKHIYSAVQITDEELTLDIADWGEQVARPQIRAVSERLEGLIATAMAGANFAHSVDYTPGDGSADDTSFFETAVEARKFLNVENVPAAGRVIVLGANAEAAALRSPHLIRANEAGDDMALREATIGRIAGFTVIGNVNSVDPDFAIAFHPTAFGFANVAPVVPDGARPARPRRTTSTRCAGSATTSQTTCGTGRSTRRSRARRASRTSGSPIRTTRASATSRARTPVPSRSCSARDGGRFGGPRLTLLRRPHGGISQVVRTGRRARPERGGRLGHRHDQGVAAHVDLYARPGPRRLLQRRDERAVGRWVSGADPAERHPRLHRGDEHPQARCRRRGVHLHRVEDVPLRRDPQGTGRSCFSRRADRLCRLRDRPDDGPDVHDHLVAAGILTAVVS
jgi:hypothetical protein